MKTNSNRYSTSAAVALPQHSHTKAMQQRTVNSEKTLVKVISDLSIENTKSSSSSSIPKDTLYSSSTTPRNSTTIHSAYHANSHDYLSKKNIKQRYSDGEKLESSNSNTAANRPAYTPQPKKSTWWSSLIPGKSKSTKPSAASPSAEFQSTKLIGSSKPIVEQHNSSIKTLKHSNSGLEWSDQRRTPEKRNANAAGQAFKKPRESIYGPKYSPKTVKLEGKKSSLYSNYSNSSSVSALYYSNTNQHGAQHAVKDNVNNLPSSGGNVVSSSPSTTKAKFKIAKMPPTPLKSVTSPITKKPSYLSSSSSLSQQYPPPPGQQPNTKSTPSPTNQNKPPKQDEDVERNSRHSEVVALLTGKRKLSPAFTNKYVLGEVLGDGAFGFVFTARNKSTGEEVAVKFIIKAKIPKELWNKSANLPVEIYMLSKLKHPNIIRYIEHIHEQDYILLVTELHGTEWNVNNPKLNQDRNPGLRDAPRSKPEASPEAQMECSPLFRLTDEQEKEIKRRTSCDLFECIDAHQNITESVCKRIIGQIALAVKHMHDNGIVHRDLKDENVVIDADYNVKLVDFGSASFIPERRERYFSKFNGTAHFASPEIANGNPYRGPEAEIWSMGVLLFTIVCGENPFQNRQEILKGEYHFPCKVGKDCAHLISKMLTYNERTRATIDQVLEHRWLKPEIEKLRMECRRF